MATLGVMLVASGANASSSTLFVDNVNSSCSDSGAGTATIPFCTIKKAATVANAGQTVLVSSGTYGGGITPAHSGTSLAPVNFAVGSGATVVVSGGSSGFHVASKSWITITGFAVDATSGPGMLVSTSTNITLRTNHVTHSGQPVSGLVANGIALNGTSNSLLNANTTDHNSDAGILIDAGSNNNVIASNVSFSNARGYIRAAAGIDLLNSTGNLVSGNISHDNEDSGFNIRTGTSGSIVNDNVSYNNGDHGIDVHNATNAEITSNTVTGNTDSGIEMTTSTGTILANNISTDNGINSPRTSGEVRADAPSATTATVDFELVNLRVAGVMFDWAGVKYSSLAAFAAATGQESHGLQADPLFAQVAAANFHLLAGSPAIDAANSAAAGEPTLDADGQARVDDPAVADTGTGPISFVDRGAFERQVVAPRVVTVTWSASENARLAQIGVDLNVPTAQVQKTSVYLLAFLVGFGSSTPTPVTLPPPNTGATYTDTWQPNEFSVIDGVKTKYVLDDIDATRFSVSIVDFLLSLSGQ